MVWTCRSAGKPRGQPVIELTGVSMLLDDPVTAILLEAILGSEVTATDATRCWLDDVCISSAPVVCE